MQGIRSIAALPGVVCALAALASTSTLAQWNYYYFDQPRPLTIDPSRIAVRETVGGVASDIPGVDLSEVEPLAVPGWSVVRAAAGVASNADIEQRVEAAAQATGFASPVFLDDYGGPLVVTQDILVGFQEDVDPITAERILQAVHAGTIMERRFGDLDGTFRIRSSARNGFDVLAMANELARRADVRFAEPDVIFTGYGALLPSDPLFPEAWGLQNTGQFGGTPGMDMSAVDAWDITTGASSVFVVIIDCGVQQDHPDILQRVPGIDTTSDARCVGGDIPGALCKIDDDCPNGGVCPMFTDGGPVNTFDDHATAVAGCVSGILDNGIGSVGIAPECRTASARTFITTTSSGEWTSQPSWTVASLTWAESIGAKVTNNSNCYGFTSSTIAAKYADTRANGMVHFASACNDGSNILGYPSSLASVNAVGALDPAGDHASFSNVGDGLAFSAPGVSIVTTDRTGAEGYDSGDYAIVQGTSFASPYAAGVAALLISQNPGIDAQTVEHVIRESAVDVGTPGYDIATGWGFVNAHRALEWNRACSSPPAPTLEAVVSTKNRYLSFVPPRGVGAMAQRRGGSPNRRCAKAPSQHRPSSRLPH